MVAHCPAAIVWPMAYVPAPRHTGLARQDRLGRQALFMVLSAGGTLRSRSAVRRAVTMCGSQARVRGSDGFQILLKQPAPNVPINNYDGVAPPSDAVLLGYLLEVRQTPHGGALLSALQT